MKIGMVSDSLGALSFEAVLDAAAELGLDCVEFATGKDVILERSAPILEAVQAVLDKHDDIKRVRIEGHTDDRGDALYNLQLSQRRADAVRDYLVQRGYPADRTQARGKGEGSPIADNASPEGRANNRRVEIVIERELQKPNP